MVAFCERKKVKFEGRRKEMAANERENVGSGERDRVKKERIKIREKEGKRKRKRDNNETMREINNGERIT